MSHQSWRKAALPVWCLGGGFPVRDGSWLEAVFVYILSKPLSSRSTSYHRELFALKVAVEFCTDYCYWRKTHNSREVHIHSDCQSAILSVTFSDFHRSHQDVIDDIRRGVQVLEPRSTTVKLHWIAGHVDSNGNELADKELRRLRKRPLLYRKV